MADSLLDIGTTEIFRLPFNWAQEPEVSFFITRNTTSFPGTATLLESVNKETPIKFTCQLTNHKKEDDFTLLEWIHEKALGRGYRFWIPYHKQQFKLTNDSPSGASTLLVEYNNAHLTYQGYERIYIKMQNGDLLTRKVTSITQSTEGVIQLNLASPLDREITKDNQFEIGRLLLCRFDADNFDLELETDIIYDVTLAFIELVKEYDEV